MTFLHPALLPLLALAAIPVVLHLLTLFRLRTVELSTYRFLFDSYVQQRRQMKFLEALLAILRTLFLAFLVLVVCRPVVERWGSLFGSGSGRDVVILIDGSASMNARTAGVSAMERAKAAASIVARGLQPDDRLTLIRVGARPEEVFSRFSTDAEAIRAKIEGLEPGPSRANLFACLGQVFGAKNRTGGSPIVYLFTDCQASGWREVRDQGLERLIPAKTKFIVVNVGSNAPLANRGVVGDPPRQHRAIMGLPIVLRPRVVNTSKTEPAEVTVGVFLDEKEVARVPLTLKPGETASKPVIYVPNEPGVLRGRFEIPADRFPDDDSFLFTLSVLKQVKVLLVNGNPSPDPMEDAALYLHAALTSGAEESGGAANLEPGRDFVRSLDVQDVPEGQLNPEILRDANVVILANCGGLNAQHFAWLRDYVSAGGGLLIFPGDKVNADIYNTQFFTVPGPQAERMTGATLGPPEGDVAKAETFERFGTIDYGHPVLTVFDDPDARYLNTARFARRFPLKLAEPRGNSWPLAKFSTGSPALVESHFGDGLVLLSAFPASPKWTNLPLKPEFVPLVLRMASQANRGPELETPSAVSPDGSTEIAVAGSWSPASGKVIDVKGRPTTLEFERSASRLLTAFDRTAEKGYYTVEVKGGRTEQPKTETSAFAVNLAPDESNFASLGEDQLREILPTADLTLVDASAEKQQELGALGERHEIWRPLIYVMFAVIGVEFMLATMGGQRREPEEEERSAADRGAGTWIGRMTGAAAAEATSSSSP